MKYGLGYTLILRITGFLSTTFGVRRTEFKYMLDLLRNEKRKKILDYGCDSGYLTYRIKDIAPKNNVCGADINESALNYARKKYPHINFYKSDDKYLKDNKFDIIVISHVLEHIKERDKFMKNVSKLLSAKGKIIVAIPQERIRGDTSIPTLLYNLVRLKFENPHVAKLDYRYLKETFNKIGFKINDKMYTNCFPPFKSKTRKFYSWSLIVSASKN